jgi:hypothetical protein
MLMPLKGGTKRFSQFEIDISQPVFYKSFSSIRLLKNVMRKAGCQAHGTEQPRHEINSQPRLRVPRNAADGSPQ